MIKSLQSPIYISQPSSEHKSVIYDMSTPYEFVAVHLLKHNDINILYTYLICLRLDFISTNSGPRYVKWNCILMEDVLMHL